MISVFELIENRSIFRLSWGSFRLGMNSLVNPRSLRQRRFLTLQIGDFPCFSKADGRMASVLISRNVVRSDLSCPLGRWRSDHTFFQQKVRGSIRPSALVSLPSSVTSIAFPKSAVGSHMCVRMYVCMYVRMYVCTYVRMYVCTYVRMYVCTYVCMYVCMYVCTYVCMYVHMYICTYVRMYVCTFVRMYVCTYVRMYVCTYVRR